MVEFGSVKYFALIFACLAGAAIAVDLKVGIYNSIPDIGDDDLASYENLIQDGYTAAYPSNTVDAVVNSSLYDPYGNLEEYLHYDGFDMLEIDTISLPGLVEKGLIVPVDDLVYVPTWNDIFPEALDAVQYEDTYYAYPTLLCGNFLIGLSPATSGNCDLESGRYNYDNFSSILTQCEGLLSSYPTYERLLGGKMNDIYGYYLPDMYVDGYIDMYGSQKAQEAVDNVLAGDIDMSLCSRMTNYVGGCSDETGSPPNNKCFYKYADSYVEESDNIYTDITNKKTMLYFGFSEKLAQIKKDNPGIVAYAAISAPLGDSGYLLQYTDALVVSASSWNSADNEKKAAMIDFITFFTSQSLRESILFGEDLSPQATRYLLQANKQVYSIKEATSDPIIVDLYWALQRGVHTPINDDTVRAEMQQKLMYSGCVCGCDDDDDDDDEQLIFNKEKKAPVDSCLAGEDDCDKAK
ncbi:PREDICTED: uncharacterized protein LOC105316590 [Amphimedon queenslandica]|uniref:Uncharacterized protein n=1 Tax=Amphimedon queenslandica TaxID=400682 RepID=A0A1X7VNC1_AMPQE|nr:PREDICTED: uncharacterized protein LOC105316590 [Amphimedon queenslandica]|eukprot:XP_011409904.1 PREDICTED: uncharacterized protein LOC105316590 [Amphimedon queenslandica]